MNAGFTGTPTDISSNTATYDPPTGLQVTTWYRRQAKDASCNTGWNTSDGVWKVTVYNNFASGAITTTGETICYNGDPAVIQSINVASGGDESISYQWLSSTDNFGTNGTNVNTLLISNSNAPTYDPPAGLTVTTWYRRQASDGACNDGWTTSAGVWKVTVNPVSVGGTVTGATTITYGSPTGAMLLAGYTGTIVKWQRRLNDGSWTDLAQINNTYNETPGLAGTWQYRAWVKSSLCSEAFSEPLTITVLPKALTISGIDAYNKVFDGTTTATLNTSAYLLIGTVSADIVALDASAYNANFNNRDIGTAKPISVTGLVITGANAGNYTLTQPSGLSANITPLPITLTVTAGQLKIYGDPDPVFTYSVVPALLAGDVFTGSLMRATGTKVGPYPIGPGTLTSGANYAIAFVGADFTINQKPITVTALAENKPYDGTLISIELPSVTPGLVSGDAPNFKQAFSDKRAGNSKTLVPSGSLNDGNGGLNYRVTFVSAHNGVIEPLAITGNISVANKEYDGNTQATIADRTLAGAIPGDQVTYSGGSATFETPDVGDYKKVNGTGLSLAGTDAVNYTVNPTAIGWADITRITANASLLVSPGTVQYSDEVVLTASITNGAPGEDIYAARSVTFSIGGQVMANASGNTLMPLIRSGSNLIAILKTRLTETVTGSMAPGNKVVTATFNDASPNFSLEPNPVTGILTISKEDATVSYSGDQLVQAFGTGTVLLKATLRDISAEPLGDAFAGDIRKATVTFVNRSTNVVIGTATVSLLNPSDSRIGTAQLSWTGVPPGDYVIGIIVGNYYVRDYATDNTVVQVYDPGEAYLVGGGNIAPTLPAGIYAPDNGKPMNIGFDVQFNPEGVISRGHTTILVRKTVNGDPRLLEIASTNITRVVVNINNPAALTGAFHGIATLSDITNPGSPVLLESSLDLTISITDRGLPGTGDGIAIILKKGSNLYSSVTGTLSLTQQLNLVSGDLIVHSTFNIGGDITDGIGDLPTGAPAGISISAYPNPSPGIVNFLIAVDRSSMVTLDILSMEGKHVSRVFEGYLLNTAAKTINYDSKLPQGIYFYRLSSHDGVAWGKVVITSTY